MWHEFCTWTPTKLVAQEDGNKIRTWCRQPDCKGGIDLQGDPNFLIGNVGQSGRQEHWVLQIIKIWLCSWTIYCKKTIGESHFFFKFHTRAKEFCLILQTEPKKQFESRFLQKFNIHLLFPLNFLIGYKVSRTNFYSYAFHLLDFSWTREKNYHHIFQLLWL